MVLYMVYALYGTVHMKYPLINCDLKDSLMNFVYERSMGQ